MFSSQAATAGPFWHLVTTLGEAQIVLPLALFGMASRLRSPAGRRDAVLWAVLLGLAVLLTTASKVAFIGWGIGSADWNFTGISGHTMFATAVYPPLLALVAGTRSPAARRAGIAAGCVLALLVGLSRLVLHVHSPSETVAGWLVGGMAALAMLRSESAAIARLELTALAAATLCMALVSVAAPRVNTHALVTQLALQLSGHQHPFTRRALLQRSRSAGACCRAGAMDPA